MKRVKSHEVAPGQFMPAGFAHLSATMFMFAREMAKQSDDGPFRPQYAYPMAAVIHASAALEAFLNEQLEMIVATWGADWESTIESLERLDSPKKWIVFPRLLHGKTFDTGREPYQSFCALVDLRNALMHYRPVATAPPHMPKKIAALSSRFAFSAENYYDWTSNVLTPSCARWACTTARDMVREYFTIAGSPELWVPLEQVAWHLSGLEQSPDDR